MTPLQTSRRNLLRLSTTTAGAVIVTGSIGFASAEAMTGLSPALINARAAMQRAKDEHEAFYSSVCEPARERWLAACDALPHTTAIYESVSGERTLSTANPRDVALANAIAVRPSASLPMRTIAAGHEQRQADIAALPEGRALKAANRQSDAMSNRWCDLEDTFLAIKPRSLTDLAFKLDTVRAFSIEDCSYGADEMAEDVQSVIAAGEG